jgi:hypothetical protein
LQQPLFGGEVVFVIEIEEQGGGRGLLGKNLGRRGRNEAKPAREPHC